MTDNIKGHQINKCLARTLKYIARRVANGDTKGLAETKWHQITGNECHELKPCNCASCEALAEWYQLDLYNFVVQNVRKQG